MSPRERERIDPDVAIETETERMLVRIIAQAVRDKDVSIGYQEGSGSKFEKWILGVLGVLVVSVVGGGISVYGRFTSLETKVEEWQKSIQRQIDSDSTRLDRLEQRR